MHADARAMTNGDLHLKKGPLRCGGPRALGGFFGRYWPGYFRSIADKGRLTEREKADLEENLTEFEADFKRLASEAPPGLQDVIARGFINSALIGAYSSRQNLAELREEIRRESLRKQGETARAANARGSRPEWEALKESLKEFCAAKGLQMVGSEPFAGSMLEEAPFRSIFESRLDPETRKRLAKRRKWPSARTVTRAIRDILKECGEAKGHS
jgi:hypothetical protein